MTTLDEVSREIIGEARTKLSPIEYIRSRVRALDDEDVVDLAVAYLYANVKQRMRQTTLDVERSAERSEPRFGTKAWDAWAHLPRNAEQAEVTRNRQAKLEESLDANHSKLNAVLVDALAAYSVELRMQWSRELLDSKFALGDGTTTTWGEATVEQHEQRISIHRVNALGGIEGMARHEQAIHDLKSSGADCLDSLVRVAA